VKIYPRFIISLVLIGSLACLVSACRKDPKLVDNNTPPTGSYVSTVQIRNYVNRIYIDLLGREALDNEMIRDVDSLKANKLSFATRANIIRRLQTDTTYLPGDSSYIKAYYNRMYEMFKQRMLEGVEDDYFLEERGIAVAALATAESTGDSLNAGINRTEILRIDQVMNVRTEYRTGLININEVFARMINNFAYDRINMNTFNFVNATFDNLFFRFPTTEEFNAGFAMVEHNMGGVLLGQSGTGRPDYIHIVTSCPEFYEGVIRWQYHLLLSRDPTAAEVAAMMSSFSTDKNLQAVQLQIMSTNEYANFR
jgi:hypothetical protein